LAFKSNEEIGNYYFALLASFFSLTEFIFEVLKEEIQKVMEMTTIIITAIPTTLT
jgi:hypothetical protein